jgi:4-cresol dehydrogenase (hydroxylating)
LNKAPDVLPPGVSAARFSRALQAFERIVGAQWVLASEEDRLTYLDLYAPGDADRHAPSCAIAPGSTEELQAIVRAANEYRVPLWPISRGKNMGYGGAAPRLRGSVIVDLGRMKRIIEVNADLGYCVVEPGVSFYDLYDHLQEHRIPLWMSVPGNSWGSVLGNALERGQGTHGDHSANLCGLEVVLADGSLVRTGMGAMRNSATWPLFRYGYGPCWDQMFCQSNFGIVTRMALWLMPEPETAVGLSIELPRREDLVWAVDALAPLRMHQVLQRNANITNWLGRAGVRTRRAEWYQGSGSMPIDAILSMLGSLDIGWWHVGCNISGFAGPVEATLRVVQDAFARHTEIPFKLVRWSRGQPGPAPGQGVPSVMALRSLDWYGGSGAHLIFSPVLPPDGGKLFAQYERAEQAFHEFGFDYYGGFTLAERYVINSNGIIFDRGHATMPAQAHGLFERLLHDAAAAGYAEYRTHLSFMDAVQDSFDFNTHALRKLNSAVKDALDPNGVLAPGKQGIWPKTYREGSA